MNVNLNKSRDNCDGTVYKCLQNIYRIIKFYVWGFKGKQSQNSLTKLVLRCIPKNFIVCEKTLKGKARYVGLHLAPAEGFVQGRFLCSREEHLYAFVGSFWQFFMFSNNLGNFEKNHYPQICLIRNPTPIKKKYLKSS